MNEERNDIIDVIWIDDDKQRTEIIKNLESKNERIKIKFVHPSKFHPKDFIGKVKLFLVDYILNKATFDEHDIFEFKGYTIAGMIREFFPDYPIYGTSEDTKSENGLYKKNKFTSENIFDKLIDFKDLREIGYEILYYDAIDFEKIRISDLSKFENIIDLLKAPLEIETHLDLILPEDLINKIYISSSKKINFKKFIEYIIPDAMRKKETISSNVILLARWIMNPLLEVPGFLYDELYTATYLGINNKYFEKIKSKFNSAKYQGVFSNTTKSLWWVSKINDIIFSNPKSEKYTNIKPWELTTKIFDIPKEYHSKCFVCKEKFPETIGSKIDNEDFKKPVHYKCSKTHPKKNRLLFFDEPRAFD